MGKEGRGERRGAGGPDGEEREREREREREGEESRASKRERSLATSLAVVPPQRRLSASMRG